MINSLCDDHPNRNQSACTIARVLFDIVFVPYGSCARLHSGNAQNFKSKVIKHSCINKTPTTPHDPIGNNHAEGFNQILLQMLDILEPSIKSDWKACMLPLAPSFLSPILRLTVNQAFLCPIYLLKVTIIKQNIRLYFRNALPLKR